MHKFHRMNEVSKTSKSGNVMAKTFLVLGIGGLIGYSALKDKLLGRPRSQIRKGLFYATLGGFILYKCQEDKFNKVVSFTKETVVQAYSNFNDALKENQRKNAEIDSLTANYEIELRKNEELEHKVNEVYSKRDSAKNLEKRLERLEQKNVLEQTHKDVQIQNNLEKNMVKEKKQNLNKEKEFASKENQIFGDVRKKEIVKNKYIKKEISPEDSAEEESYSDNMVSPPFFSMGYDLRKEKNYAGKYVLQSYILLDEKTVWFISDGKKSFKDISLKLYEGRVSAELLREYNQLEYSIDSPIELGVPVGLIDRDFVRKVNWMNIYRGCFPKFCSLATNINSLDEMIDKFYSEDSKEINVFESIKKYNQLYSNDIHELRNRAISSGAKSYFVLIPRFLEGNLSADYHERLVRENAESGKY